MSGAGNHSVKQNKILKAKYVMCFHSYVDSGLIYDRKEEERAIVRRQVSKVQCSQYSIV